MDILASDVAPTAILVRRGLGEGCKHSPLFALIDTRLCSLAAWYSVKVLHDPLGMLWRGGSPQLRNAWGLNPATDS